MNTRLHNWWLKTPGIPLGIALGLKLWPAVAALTSALAIPTAWAAEDETEFGEVISAVVAVRATVPDTARTAAALGTEREGSGVVIDSSGLVVTIGYLILEATEAEIMLTDGQNIPVKIIGYDHDSGFGLLRASRAVGVRPMPLGDSNILEESAKVLVSSFGGIDSVRPAVVVSRREFAGYWEYLLEDAIFTSPAHPGFGGAALIGADAKLLGIGSLIVSDAREGANALPGNMFVPIDELKHVMGDMLISGRSSKPPHPWLGLYTEESGNNVLVARLAPDGPAADAGIKTGDLIVGVGNEPVHSMAELYRNVWALGDAGVDVPMVVLRKTELMEIKVQSSDRYKWLRLNSD